MRRPDRYNTVLFSAFTSCTLLALFQFRDSQMILMPCYFFIVFCIMVMNVYIILWVDQFGMFSFKTLFLSLINLAKTVGISLGLLLNYTFLQNDSKNHF